MDKRKPTYGSAVRMAELILLLSKEWRPVPLEQITARLGISPRTAQRYRKALNDYFSVEDESGDNARRDDFITVDRERGADRWYLRDFEEMQTSNFFRIISVFIAKALFQSLDGTIIKDGMERILLALKEQIPTSKLIDLYERKIRYSGFGKKSYASKNDLIATILKGLVYQKKLQIRYFSKEAGKEKYHIISPYTLLLHHESLFLIAKVDDYDKHPVRTFLIDRMKKVIEREENFKYPSDYNPDDIIKGSFGIYEVPSQKPIKVRVSFDESLWDRISNRNWHRTQNVSQVKDGRFELMAILTNVIEFKPWVLQFGSLATVLEPDWLREEIKAELLSACRNY